MTGRCYVVRRLARQPGGKQNKRTTCTTAHGTKSMFRKPKSLKHMDMVPNGS